MVHHARQALGALALAACLAAAGCGGGEKKAAPKASGANPAAKTTAAPASGNPTLGDLALADCGMWRRGDYTARMGTVYQLRSYQGYTGGNGVQGAVLPDKVAYATLDAMCKPDYATYFKLYKLYGRAAAFQPQR